MMISTKGRYALRVMIDLAQHRDDGYISLSTIARRQNTSPKYSESLISALSRAGHVESLRGKEGGYRLTRSNEMYTIGSILKAVEGSLAPVACVSSGTCEHSEDCITLPMWQGLDAVIDKYLESVTLDDLINRKVKKID